MLLPPLLMSLLLMPLLMPLPLIPRWYARATRAVGAHRVGISQLRCYLRKHLQLLQVGQGHL